MNIALHTLFNPPKVEPLRLSFEKLNEREVELLSFLRKEDRQYTIQDVAKAMSICDQSAGKRLMNLTRAGYLRRRYKSVKNENYNNYKNIMVYELV